MAFNDLFFTIVVPLLAAVIAALAAHYLASQRGVSQVRRLTRELQGCREQQQALETRMQAERDLAHARSLILLRWQREYLEPLARIREQLRLETALPFDTLRASISPVDVETINHVDAEVSSLRDAHVNVHPDVLVHLGLFAVARGDEAAARSYFETAIRQDGTAQDARANLGILLLRAGDHSGALDQFNALRELAPQRWEGHYGAGLARIAQHSPETAIEALTTSIRLRPEEPRTFCALARAYAATGEMDRAMESVQVALKLNTRHAEARLVLQELLLKAGRFDHVIEECQRFLTRQDDALAHFHLASAYALSGQADLSLQALRRALQLDDRLRSRAGEDQNLLSLHEHRRFRELLEGKPGLF